MVIFLGANGQCTNCGQTDVERKAGEWCSGNVVVDRKTCRDNNIRKPEVSAPYHQSQVLSVPQLIFIFASSH